MIVSLYVLFEILSIVLCLHYLYGEKFRLDKITIVFLIVEMSWMLLIYYMPLDQRLSLVIYPVIALYCGFKFGFKLRKILVNNILYIIIIGMLQSTIMSLFVMLFRLKEITPKESLLINVCVFVVVILFLRKVNIKGISNILQRKEVLLLVTMIVAVIILVLCLLVYREKNGFDFSYYFMFVTSAILVTIIVVDIGKHKMQVIETKAELKLHKLYEESFQKLIDDISAKQHEFNNHINTIYSQHFLCDTYEELVDVQRKYCSDIVVSNKYNKLLSKGNSIVLGFLYGKFTEAEGRGINVTYKVSIDELQSDIPIYKIVEILGNLINNAIEALEKDDTLNKMEVVVLEKENQIRMEVNNECKDITYSMLQNFFKKGYSKKGEGHGYGLYNVKRICEEYGILIENTIEQRGEKTWLRFIFLYEK